MDVADFIDRKLRLGKADALLLYLSGFQSIVVTLSQLFFGMWTLAYYPGILLFVTVMPVYVGYVRGAITRNSITERTRGWLYLIFGTVMYLVTVSVWLLSRVSILFRVSEAAVFFLLGFGMARIVPASGERILRALGGSRDDTTDESFYRTGEAIMWMSLLLAFITANPETMSVSLNGIGAAFFVGLSAVGIWNAEKWARLSERGYVRERQRMRNGKLRWLSIAGILIYFLGWAFSTLVNLSSIMERFFALTIIMIGVVLVLVSLFLSGRLSL